MSSAAFRVLRLVSITICVIVSASFLVFAVNQTKTASKHQQTVLEETQGANKTTTPEKSSLHRALDEVSEGLTSPFNGILSSTDSEWAKRAFLLLMALLVYGFGLGYLARVIRVRV